MAEKLPQSLIVIGAGVVGVATAYALARHGAKVTLIDQNEGPGQGASYANGAQLSYCYTDALASPKLIRQVPGLALGRDPAFRFHWRADIDYWRWLIAFLGNCTKSKFSQNTLAALKLAAESRLAMQDMQRRHELQFGNRVAGKMHLYANARAFADARQTMTMKNGACSDQIALSPHEAADIEPALDNQTGRLSGVIYSPSEEVGDARLFSAQMVRLLEAEYNVKCHFNMPADHIELASDRVIVKINGGEKITADHVVLCTGAAAKLSKRMGHSFPIQPLKGYSFTAPPGPNPPKTSITDAAKRLVFTNLGNRIRVAGLADLGDVSANVKPARIQALIDAARTSLPDAADYDAAGEFWAGHRPMTPDSLPIIARPEERLSINAGHGMLGWTMAMGSGERLARLLAGN